MLAHHGRRKQKYSSKLFIIKDLNGGERGIRTPDTLSGLPVFKTGAINHSASSPRDVELSLLYVERGFFRQDLVATVCREFFTPISKNAKDETRKRCQRGACSAPPGS